MYLCSFICFVDLCFARGLAVLYTLPNASALYRRFCSRACSGESVFQVLAPFAVMPGVLSTLRNAQPDLNPRIELAPRPLTRESKSHQGVEVPSRSVPPTVTLRPSDRIPKYENLGLISAMF